MTHRDTETEREERGRIIKMREQKDMKLLRGNEREQKEIGGKKKKVLRVQKAVREIKSGRGKTRRESGRWGQMEGNLRDLACT